MHPELSGTSTENHCYGVPPTFRDLLQLLHVVKKRSFFRTDIFAATCRVGEIRTASIAAVNGLYASGATALYKTVAFSLDQLNAIRAAQTASGGPQMNFALVVRRLSKLNLSS